ncbi:hypothetical protein NOR_05138 [Metarhizium rileyi]|uniref:Uncharacterized protein n=1 Tax=Metarhizium rileyi (strain RCEF 4871) TaxID=1649241 RepID=A0A167CVN7_METRR|nr:hypothetical protein NOR_05138 [Metarhizium rileyi RCEF 4871]
MWSNFAAASPLTVAVNELEDRWKHALEAVERERPQYGDSEGDRHLTVDQSWDESLNKIEFEKISKKNFHLLRSWKLSWTFLGCSPCAVICPGNGLNYESATPLTAGAAGQFYEIWPEDFCQALSLLVCHSCWGGDARKLTAAIQCAAICRSNDRRPWTFPFDLPSCDTFHLWLHGKVSARRRLNLHDLCGNYMAAQIARGAQPSMMLLLFHRIGFNAKKSPPTTKSNEGPPRLAINTSDLEAVLDAVNGIYGKMNDFKWEEVALIAFKAMSFRKAFPSGKQLRQVHTQSFLNELEKADQASFSHCRDPSASRQHIRSAHNHRDPARRVGFSVAESHRPTGVKKNRNRWKNRRPYKRGE